MCIVRCIQCEYNHEIREDKSRMFCFNILGNKKVNVLYDRKEHVIGCDSGKLLK